MDISNLPLGCANEPNAPWIENESDIVCPCCHGSGKINYTAYNFDADFSVEVTRETYEALPATIEEAGRGHYIQDECDICPECKGEGVVIYEPYCDC